MFSIQVLAATLTLVCCASEPSPSDNGMPLPDLGMIDQGRIQLAEFVEAEGCDFFDLQYPGQFEGLDSGIVTPYANRITPNNHPHSGHRSNCRCRECQSGLMPARHWLDLVRVGYDEGFVIASEAEADLDFNRFPFRLRFNGWGQIRHTRTEVAEPNRDLNQFQLKRGRLIFSGGAYTPNLKYFVQLDGRSSSGDDIRLLDYFLSFDLGNRLFGLERGRFEFRTGQYKMPFNLARWLSGREFEFADRSVASMYFDVNRSFAWGLYGHDPRFANVPMYWEIAIFNGLVTGGAETGASGTLDDNFAYSGRIMLYPIGDWGRGELADFEYHKTLAMRMGAGFASSEVDRIGSTEFNSVRVVDSGQTLASLLPPQVDSYGVDLYSIDASFKYRGWTTTIETYFRTVGRFGGLKTPTLNDTGFWLQTGYMIVPNKLQLLARWSRVVGDSGTLGVKNESSDEVAGGIAWYIRENRSKIVVDMTHINGAPIQSSALDINPGDDGWVVRSQIQFSF